MAVGGQAYVVALPACAWALAALALLPATSAAAAPTDTAPPATTAPSPAPPTLGLTLEHGWIDASVGGEPGALVAVSELVAGARTPLSEVTLGNGVTPLVHLARWSCQRLQRTFVASQSDGSAVSGQRQYPNSVVLAAAGGPGAIARNRRRHDQARRPRRIRGAALPPRVPHPVELLLAAMRRNRVLG
jgi:hypothetical protein